MNESTSFSSRDLRRKRDQLRLESQLEGVLDDEYAVKVRAAGFSHESLPESERDREQVQTRRTRDTQRLPHRVQVSFGPHEASAHKVRIEGRVAKAQKDVRTPFHATMHRWRTPFAERTDIAALVARSADLYVEVLIPEVFEEQFTPGHSETAYQESQPSFWTRVRRPFIRWERREAARDTADTVIEEVRDIAQEVRQPETISIQAMPEEVVPSRWNTWRAAVRSRLTRAKEQEQAIAEEVLEEWQRPSLEWSIRPARLVIAFLGMVCLVAIPAGAVSWSRNLTASVQNTKLVLAASTDQRAWEHRSLEQWSAQFSKLQAFALELEASHGLAFSLANILPTTRASAKSVEALLTVAKEGSEAARLLTLGASRLSSESDGARVDERLEQAQTYVREASPHMQRVFAAAREMNPDTLPESVREQAMYVKQELLALEPLVSQADTLLGLLLAMIGHEQSRTYLVLFQNQAELRPSGGFMGSYAEVQLDRGEIRKLLVPGGGPYDLRSQLRTRWQPPEPLRLVGSRWEFQDANWSPDFAQTASTIQTFWDRSGQPTLDGIIAVNATILPKLLALTGPIEMESYGKIITQENVVLETQKAVELEYDREKNTPKAFIGDLNREVLARLRALPLQRLPDVLQLAATSLETKEIQVWFAKETEQAAAKQFGWTGEWPVADAFDSLAIVGANIAGQKSDAVVEEEVFQNVVIDTQGSVSERVLLAREHRGERGTLFYGANNVQYVRAYVPAGSVFTGLEGTEDPAPGLFEEITEKEEPFPGLTTTTEKQFGDVTRADVGTDLGREVLGAWVQVRPGMTRETAISYTIPRTTGDMAQAFFADSPAEQGISDAYVLRIQSQSGAPRAHSVRIQYPPAWKPVRLSEGMRSISAGVLEWKVSSLEQNQLLYALFTRYAN